MMRKTLYIVAVLLSVFVMPVLANELDDIFQRITEVNGVFEIIEVPEQECVKSNINEGSIARYGDEACEAVDSILSGVASPQFIDFRNDDVAVDGWIVRIDENDITVLMRINLIEDSSLMVMLVKGPEKLLEGIQLGE